MIPKVGGDSGVGGFYRILGTEASLSVPDLTRWSYGGRENGSWTEVLEKEFQEVDSQKVPFDLQVQHLVDVVLNGEEPSCSGEEGLRAMVVCEAVKVAMASGEAVDIDGMEIVRKKKVTII